jgi:hypothetical protein
MTTRSTHAHPVMLAVAVLASAAVACGSATRGEGAASSSVVPSSAAPSAPTTSAAGGSTSPGPSLSATFPPTPTSTSATATRTLTGTAFRAAEPVCIGLRTGGMTYELTGAAALRLASGGGGYGQQLGRIRVLGHLAPATTASHCMMGPIFVVSTLTRL